MTIDERTRIELEAAVYRRLIEHLRTRTDVQNIDLMNLAGFCRNCLSNWMKEAADARGIAITKDESRELVYGEPYDQWRAKHQKEASPEQKARLRKSCARALTGPEGPFPKHCYGSLVRRPLPSPVHGLWMTAVVP